MLLLELGDVLSQRTTGVTPGTLPVRGGSTVGSAWRSRLGVGASAITNSPPACRVARGNVFTSQSPGPTSAKWG